jgi:hypothetical protein
MLILRSSQSCNRVKALSGTTRRLPRWEVCLLAGFSVVATALFPAPASAKFPFPGVENAQVPLNLTYDKPAVVGARVHATASGLPAGKKVDLTWGTVNGGWVIEDYYHFRGKKFTDTKQSLGEFPVDASGNLGAQFTIPEDYGGVHEVLADIDGKTVAQNGINVTQSFELSPTSGPVGTPLELKVKGLGWRTMESTWVVNWDNRNAGFVTAVNTRGTATARFRATGPVGDHIVKMYTGYEGQAYLNYEQSPVAKLPRPQFTFHTTPGGAEPGGYAEEYQPQPVPTTEIKIAGAKLALAPTQGAVGTKAMLRGEGFPANTSLDLIWETYVGSRVSGNGFEAEQHPIGQVKVGSDGRIDAPVTVPEDLGGLHALALRHENDVVGRVSFVIETSVVSISPSSGPAGTPVTIHLKGVGWTEYDNIYVATYDNAYMGYVCGFNSQGDVVVNFTATGETGEHIIDLYPGIYEGPATELQQFYRLPQLTYADDHPGNKIPALRFMFDVTASPALHTTASALPPQ